MTAASRRRHDSITATIVQLEQLITALNRQIPLVAGTGERRIAQDAASLRDAAVARLAQLKAPGDRGHVARFDQHTERRGSRGPSEPVDKERLLSFVPAYDD
jgi:hypothetical protein